MQLDYTPPPTLRQFHLDKTYGRFVIGPVGSGKTFALFMELLRVAAQQAPAQDGIRYTRMAIVRNTLQQIKSTVGADILSILGPIANLHVSSSTIQIRVADVHSDWLLIPLEDAQDQRRLLSTQFTMVALEEFREIRYSMLDAISGRVGRYPSKALVPEGATQWGIIGTSNPFSEGSDWFRGLVVDHKPDYKLFRQPSALSPEAENIQNLKPGYYDLMVANNTEEWCKVHVEGEFGEDDSGQSVFGRLFDRDVHCTEETLQPNRMRPLLVMLDVGRNAAALIGQVDAEGRLLVMQEVVGDDLGLHSFVSEQLVPALRSERFAGMSVHVVADPKGRDRSQLREETAFSVVQAAGLPIYPAVTNDIDKRIRAVQGLMVQTRRGRPALLIDENECPMLIRALTYEYRYKRQKNGQLSPKPDKLHPWSDLCDALQYGCLAVNADLPSRVMARQAARQVKSAEIPVAAWT